MSAAAASADAPAKKSPKKLILGIVAVLVVLLLAGAAALVLLKKPAESDEEGAEEEEVAAVEHEAGKGKKGAKAGPPVFLPLDPFTVNLADKDAERYAQVGITLEVDTPEMAEQLKGYMPAIRNNVLMVLAHKTSVELLERAGKEKLAAEIMRESVRPMGIEIPDPDQAAAEEEEEAPKSSKKKKKKKKAPYNPVHQVHFSNFIIQ
ncbi:flagellar basal body-associated FliL family protein [Caldimonas brevitalea]|uniref:Flagellar protein FliL n=1 Tax=Caldimonas brevitalea TaxID=413882 RepID=A0A0G3BNP2_9BURK|nr:flagellar basal body-associated FliL family protein [Caldimonas brevitalea]AKJ31017.1 flagellar basal body rod protein [Caldimonas brevitalea]